MYKQISKQSQTPVPKHSNGIGSRFQDFKSVGSRAIGFSSNEPKPFENIYSRCNANGNRSNPTHKSIPRGRETRSGNSIQQTHAYSVESYSDICALSPAIPCGTPKEVQNRESIPAVLPNSYASRGAARPTPVLPTPLPMNSNLNCQIQKNFPSTTSFISTSSKGYTRWELYKNQMSNRVSYYRFKLRDRMRDRKLGQK